MGKKNFIPLQDYISLSPKEMLERSVRFYKEINRRRTVREFSDKSVDKKVIEHCISAAGTAPSGANLQPWHFVAISDPELKKKFDKLIQNTSHIDGTWVCS